MSNFRQGRYSWMIKPISYFIDLTILNIIGLFLLKNEIYWLNFIVIVSIGWIVTTLITKFYEVYRFSSVVRLFELLARQTVFFTLFVFACSGVFPNYNLDPIQIFKYIIACFLFISVFKYFSFFLLKRYRAYFKGNIRRTIILGTNEQSKAISRFFEDTPESGYINTGMFPVNGKEQFDLNGVFSYIIENKVDEIYCSLEEVPSNLVRAITKFADNNLKIVKFIPKQTTILNKELKRDFYGLVPVLEFRSIPLDDPYNLVIKRIFDVIFSLAIILFVMSWLTPVLAFFIKLESKGPVFFKQKRNGYNYKSFNCIKFRSMIINEDADLIQVSKSDERITRVGRFMRKTSIDELPQFFNVLIGDMSVVGPRPHMLSHTEVYANKVDKFMVRHFVKPGITGLAQVSGYRGEIETDSDIIGRVKFDIFYIENWSLFLDLKIIVKTVIKAIMGDEKAY